MEESHHAVGFPRMLVSFLPLLWLKNRLYVLPQNQAAVRVENFHTSNFQLPGLGKVLMKMDPVSFLPLS